MKKTLLPLLLISASMFLSCSDTTGNENSTLSGTVLDISTQEPISGVKITIEEQEATSDASGHYQLKNIPPDTYDIKAKIDNYALFDEEVSLKGGENNIDIELETFAAYCERVTSILYQGRTYNTVTIGNQCWFKENLNVGTRIDYREQATNNPVIEKYCYNNRVSECDSFGALYQWDEAMRYLSAYSNQGICPDGWHIPTKEEFDALREYIGDDGNSLKAIGQGNSDGEHPEGEGTNTSGFSALLSGEISYEFGSPQSVHHSWGTGFWSSTEKNPTQAFQIGLFDWFPNIAPNDKDKRYGFSIRCLKD